MSVRWRTQSSFRSVKLRRRFIASFARLDRFFARLGLAFQMIRMMSAPAYKR
jgi:hypothetical protein